MVNDCTARLQALSCEFNIGVAMYLTGVRKSGRFEEFVVSILVVVMDGTLSHYWEQSESEFPASHQSEPTSRELSFAERVTSLLFPAILIAYVVCISQELHLKSECSAFHLVLVSRNGFPETVFSFGAFTFCLVCVNIN